MILFCCFFQLSLHSVNVFFAFFNHVSFVQPVDIIPLFNYVKPEFCSVTIFLNLNKIKVQSVSLIPTSSTASSVDQRSEQYSY